MKNIENFIKKTFFMILAVVITGVNVLQPTTVNAYTTGATFSTYYTTDNVNVRKGPGTSYASYGIIPANTVLWTGQYQGTSGSWIKIRIFNSKTETTGYINSSYLKTTTTNRFYTATDNVNIRKGPGTSYGIITTIPKGADQRLWYAHKVHANGYTWVATDGANSNISLGSSGYYIGAYAWVALDYFK
ncbi:SH3 domain-containing protein [Ruminiclostridium josui]|uniref:SH3 domain-containing protein n=1 Tax=Ruminiclostridium josui TaxID=1499 RepID=UPI000464B96D|nr:SH3 domain-containing protein [Ruminiclostridium josui]